MNMKDVNMKTAFLKTMSTAFKKGHWKKTTWSDYPGVGLVYDADVGKFAMKHLRWRDRLNPGKIGEAVIISQLILFKVIEEDELPKKKNWKFYKDFGGD